MPNYGMPIRINLNSLSYLLGVYYGDGCVIKKKGEPTRYIKNRFTYDFCLTSKDEEFIKIFSNHGFIMTGRKVATQSYEQENRIYYKTAISTKKLSAIILRDFEYHRKFIEARPDCFIRGFFDSEGGCYYEKDKNVFRLRCYNTDKGLLEYISKLLDTEYRIHSSIWVNAKVGRLIKGKVAPQTMDCYVLQIIRRVDVDSYMRQIGFSITRKREAWERVRGEKAQGGVIPPSQTTLRIT